MPSVVSNAVVEQRLGSPFKGRPAKNWTSIMNELNNAPFGSWVLFDKGIDFKTTTDSFQSAIYGRFTGRVMMRVDKGTGSVYVRRKYNPGLT